MTSNSSSSNSRAQAENTGRWTQEEHRYFLEGLEKHGKGWKKIASLIKSRTVVQIRTHAQKYFQKLAKARHNGEDGDVTMEGRTGGMGIHQCSGPGGNINGGMAIPPYANDPLKKGHGILANVGSSEAGSDGAGGMKRKCIESVVVSAQREGKRLKESNKHPQVTLPSLSPCLTPFMNYTQGGGQPPSHPPQQTNGGQQVHNNTTGIGSTDIVPPSGLSLEESLYRFLSPLTVDQKLPQSSSISGNGTPSATMSSTSQSNNGNKVSHSNETSNHQNQFIILPDNNNNKNTNNKNHTENNLFEGTSPTCVTDLNNYPFNTNNKLFASVPEPPQWYARGADIDELLHEADALNWLADSGDINEVYPRTANVGGSGLQQTSNNGSDNKNISIKSSSLGLNNIEVVSLSGSEGNSTGTAAITNNTNAGDKGRMISSSSNTEAMRNLATDALPPVVSNANSGEVFFLPNLFDSSNNVVGSFIRNKISTPNLFLGGSECNLNQMSNGNLADESFSVFDSAFDEQAFVSALLECNENSPCPS